MSTHSGFLMIPVMIWYRFKTPIMVLAAAALVGLGFWLG